MDETPSRLVPPSPTAKDRSSSPPASQDARIPSFETMDRLGRAVTARLTQGISPHALYAAWFDWASHLVNAPGRLIELGSRPSISALASRASRLTVSPGRRSRHSPQPGDHRFDDRAWQQLPYVLAAGLSRAGSLVGSATREVRGMTPKNAARAPSSRASCWTSGRRPTCPGSIR